jgi:outer membrane protein OmpA-like peptidoglycan-associated protein
VAHLAKVVERHHYKSVDLAGYTDNVFSPAFNQSLNQNRASVVQAELSADLQSLGVHHVTVTIVIGGPLIVTASNTTAKGRAANRRVIATLKAG